MVPAAFDAMRVMVAGAPNIAVGVVTMIRMVGVVTIMIVAFSLIVVLAYGKSE